MNNEFSLSKTAFRHTKLFLIPFLLFECWNGLFICGCNCQIIPGLHSLKNILWSNLFLYSLHF